MRKTISSRPPLYNKGIKQLFALRGKEFNLYLSILPHQDTFIARPRYRGKDSPITRQEMARLGRIAQAFEKSRQEGRNNGNLRIL